MNFARTHKHNMYIYFYNSCFSVTNQLKVMEVVTIYKVNVLEKYSQISKKEIFNFQNVIH